MSRHYKKTIHYKVTSQSNGIHHYLRLANSTRDELAMWLDHFLLPTQFSAIHAKKIGLITYADIAVIIAAKHKSLEASVRRKQKELEKKEKQQLIEEAEILRMYME